jgi:hypothetical protein
MHLDQARHRRWLPMLADLTTTRFVPRLLDPRPRHACVALLLLPPSSPRRCGVVHGDCSSVTFSTAPSCPPGAILPLYCTRASLVGYRSSPPGRLWPSAISCFKCFRRMFLSVSFGRCVCCNVYIHMLQRLFHVTSISFRCFKRMFQVFHLDVAEVDLDIAYHALCKCMFSTVSYICCKCFIWMLHIFTMDFQVFRRIF